MTCPLLYAGFEVNTYGRARPCCEYTGFATDKDGRELNVVDDGFTDIFFSEYFQNLRNRTDLPEGCIKCIKQEELGFVSRRQREIERLGTNVPTTPMVVDLKLGNTCNLQCIICNAYSSSKVLQEEVRLGFNAKPDKQLQRDFKWPNEDRFWNEITNHIQDLAFVDIMGGEPMLAKKQRRLLDTLIDSGRAKNIFVNYVTNGTIWDEDIIELFPEFGYVNITLSADGVRDVYEYCRYPAVWSEYETNLMKYRQLPNCSVTVCYSVSAYSVFDIMNSLEYYYDLGVNVWLNIVYNHDRSIQALPLEVKHQIKKKFADEFNPEWNKIMPFSDIDAIIKYMYDGDGSNWLELVDRINRIETLRNNSLVDIIPELKNYWVHRNEN